MKLLVAIPCLNEEKHIGQVIRNLPHTFEGIDDISVLVVDDGSTDRTAEVAIGEGAIVVSHIQNKGLGCAFQTAMNYAAEHNYDIMVNMDGDGQFDSADIGELIKPILEHKADVTTASRFIDKTMTPDMPRIKYWGNQWMSKIISYLCREKFYDVSCGFRAYSKETILKANFHGKYTYTQESFIFFTFQNMKVIEVPVKVQYFKDRRSRVAGNLWKYARKTMGIILSLYKNYYPMRMFGSIASVLFVIAIIFGGVFVAHYICTGLFTGYLFAGLIAAFSFLCGLAFLCCGIVLQEGVRTRENQNRILYLMRKQQLDEE